MHSRTLPVGLIAILLVAFQVQAQPVVPGFTVETYATVAGPVGLSFAADGALFAGRDIPDSMGGDTVKIHRIPPGGGAGVEFGASGIPDPDGVLVDLDGSISGTAGAVVVTGQVPGAPTMGQIVAVLPDESIITLFGPSTSLHNPNYLARGSGGLLISDSDLSQLLEFVPPGPPTVFVPAASAPTFVAVAGPNHVFISHADGVIRRYDAVGALIDDNFVTGLGGGVPLAVSPDGPFGTNLFLIDQSGQLLSVAPDGSSTVAGTGFPTSLGEIEFGPDKALYVASFAAGEILRVAPAAETSTTTTTATSTSTTVVTTSTTTSTVPAGCDGVPVGPTFGSLDCRIADLIAQVEAETALGDLQPKLEQKLGKAKERTEQAEAFCLEPTLKRARSRLKQTVRAMIQFSHRLRSRAVRKKVPEEIREPLAASGDGIRDDASALRGALVCPDDAQGI